MVFGFDLVTTQVGTAANVRYADTKKIVQPTMVQSAIRPISMVIPSTVWLLSASTSSYVESTYLAFLHTFGSSFPASAELDMSSCCDTVWHSFHGI
jgi:hypothetical protein